MNEIEISGKKKKLILTVLLYENENMYTFSFIGGGRN